MSSGTDLACSRCSLAAVAGAESGAGARAGLARRAEVTRDRRLAITPASRVRVRPFSRVTLLSAGAVLLAIFFCSYVSIAEAKRRKKKKNGGSGIPPEFIMIMKYILVGIFAPTILFFLYNVVRDPMTPHLLWELGMRLREKTSGYLGKDGEESRRYRAGLAEPQRTRVRRRI